MYDLYTPEECYEEECGKLKLAVADVDNNKEIVSFAVAKFHFFLSSQLWVYCE